jgi:hypothetical protein
MVPIGKKKDINYMQKFNSEQHEAIQAEANRKMEEMIKTLPLEDQEKYRVVFEVNEKLKAANIAFYLFPLLKATSDNKIIEVVPAYHNMYEYYGEDFEGLSEYNDRLFGTLALIFGRTCDQALWYAKKFLYYLNPKN